MELTIQLMMGLSLAACTGLRTWLPMLVVGALARSGYMPLNQSYSFLASDGVLIAFAVASVLELLGDKVIAIDHFLDAAGTFIRPIAGTILASALLVKMDPGTATMLGLVAGGGTALTIHTGKALARTKVSALSPFHLGVGNAVVSTVEDIVAGIGVFLSILVPIIMFFFSLMAAAGAIVLIVIAYKHGRRVFARFGSSAPAAPAPARVS